MKLGRTLAALVAPLVLMAAAIALAPPGFAEDLIGGPKTAFVITEARPETSSRTSSAESIQSTALTATEDTPPNDGPIASSPEGSRLVAMEAQGNQYDQSILETLRAMRLSLTDLALWGMKHPTSILNKLKDFSTEDQQTVSTVVRYIRGNSPYISPKTAWRIAAALVYYSGKYGIPVHLSTAVAHTESQFNPSARSSKGAMGVMQVMWKVHNGLLQANGIASKDEMMDPEKGVAAGCLLLSRYVKAYGSIPKALARYYGGSSVAYFRKVNTKMANIKTSMPQ